MLLMLVPTVLLNRQGCANALAPSRRAGGGVTKVGDGYRFGTLRMQMAGCAKNVAQRPAQVCRDSSSRLVFASHLLWQWCR